MFLFLDLTSWLKNEKESFMVWSRSAFNITYVCRRSGKNRPPRGLGKRPRKIPSIKTGVCCPAQIRIRNEDGKIVVDYCKTHLGHDIAPRATGEKRRTERPLPSGIFIKISPDDVQDNTRLERVQRLEEIDDKPSNASQGNTENVWENERELLQTDIYFQDEGTNSVESQEMMEGDSTVIYYFEQGSNDGLESDPHQESTRIHEPENSDTFGEFSNNGRVAQDEGTSCVKTREMGEEVSHYFEQDDIEGLESESHQESIRFQELENGDLYRSMKDDKLRNADQNVGTHTTISLEERRNQEDLPIIFYTVRDQRRHNGPLLYKKKLEIIQRLEKNGALCKTDQNDTLCDETQVKVKEDSLTRFYRQQDNDNIDNGGLSSISVEDRTEENENTEVLLNKTRELIQKMNSTSKRVANQKLQEVLEFCKSLVRNQSDTEEISEYPNR